MSTHAAGALWATAGDLARHLERHRRSDGELAGPVVPAPLGALSAPGT